MTARAVLSADQRSITLKRSQWQMTFAVEHLGRWLAFYRQMRDRKAPRDPKGNVTGPGPYAGHYEPVIVALERVQKIVAALCK